MCFKTYGEEEVRRALLEPIGAPLCESWSSPEKNCRRDQRPNPPMPTPKVTPALLDGRTRPAPARSDITLVFAWAIIESTQNKNVGGWPRRA